MRGRTRRRGAPTSPPAGTVAVLGASAGLGAALAHLHRRRGDDVVAVARREERLLELGRAPAGPVSGAWYVAGADLADGPSLSRLSDALIERGPLVRAYLVAAADEAARAGTLEERLAAIERYHRLLFTSWVALTETLIEARAVGPESTLVAISSIAAGVPFPGLALYGAGKAALEAWARTARERPGPRCVVVRPGRFDSEFFGPQPFLVDRLPFARALEVMRAVDRGRDDVHLGTLSDVVASRAEAMVRRLSSRLVRDASPSPEEAG